MRGGGVTGDSEGRHVTGRPSHPSCVCSIKHGSDQQPGLLLPPAVSEAENPPTRTSSPEGRGRESVHGLNETPSEPWPGS